MWGFYISKLSVQGQNVPSVEISFTRGANVVQGASDTGKSYIFSALNYVLGRSQPPKDFTENFGYERILLEIGLFRNEEIFTLLRTIGANSVEVKACPLSVFFTSPVEKRIFKTTVKTDSKESLSNFILQFCGLDNKKLLKNKNRGVKENLGLSSILKFSFVHEDVISTERSPFYFSGGNTNYIKDQSFLNLLLTGEDYSSVAEREEKGIKETRISSKLQFISLEISRYGAERERLTSTMKETETPVNYDHSISKLQEELENLSNEASEISQRKTALMRVKDEISLELNNVNELLYRFGILQRQYDSDLQRLQFILETDNLSSQISDTICPICSSPLEHDSLNHIKEIENFRESVKGESDKIMSKVNDLRTTISGLEDKRGKLVNRKSFLSQQIESLEKRLRNDFGNKVELTRERLDSFVVNEKIIGQISFIDDEISRLFKENDKLMRSLNADDDAEEIQAIPKYSNLAELSEFIESRLKRWRFNDNAKVVFDSTFKTFDISISGKSRRSSGKGKKAISYSSAVLGTLDYCMSKNLPFTNLIVLDSPLTTYEEKRQLTPKEGNTTILNAFFEDLSKTSKDCQIIVLENKEPKEELQELLNTQIFTGLKNLGRYGFFLPSA
jgi:hypothetical protein